MIDPSPENPNQDKYLKTKQKQKSTNLDTFTLLKTKDKEENLRDNQRKKDIAIRKKTQQTSHSK